jgi:hypothetical protein
MFHRAQHPHRSGLAAAAFLTGVSAWCCEARAQGLLWSASGDKPGDTFGYETTITADVSGDGVPDLAVAAGTRDSSGNFVGTIRFLDGTNGATLFDHVGTATLPVYSVVDLHDVDGDGVEDFLGRTGVSRVYVWSGRTQGVLSHVADNGDAWLDVGDVDQDGVDDFGLGPWFAANVRVYSGKNGTRLLTIKAPSGSSSSWGQHLAALGDVNGDGFPDLLITDYDYSSYAGAAYIQSLKDGSQLSKITGAYGAGLGLVAAADGDFDQDGITDFVLAAPWEVVGSLPQVGAVHIYSGASSTEIARIDGTTAYGTLLLDNIAGDIDGDGVPDLALPLVWDAHAATYIRWLYSGRTMGRLYGMQATSTYGFPKIFPAADLDGDGFDDFLLSMNDGSSGVLPGTVEAHRGAPVFLTAYPQNRKSPYPNGSSSRTTNESTFYFHLAGFQPKSLVSLYVVEEDGAATSDLVFALPANAMGEVDRGAVFLPSRAGTYTYKVQAFGTAATGASVATSVEAIEYD